MNSMSPYPMSRARNTAPMGTISPTGITRELKRNGPMSLAMSQSGPTLNTRAQPTTRPRMFRKANTIFTGDARQEPVTNGNTVPARITASA